MGYRQVALALRNERGICMSGKTVLRLMRDEGLACTIRRKRCNSYRGEQDKVARNVLDRDFHADGPMEKLATDVTEFHQPWGKAYLSPVMDLYNNEIVAWSVSEHPGMAQAGEMIETLRPRPEGPAPLHSDQGWQYRQGSYQPKLAELGIEQSVSRKATCLGSACIGGSFGHMKDELYRGRRFDPFETFRAELNAHVAYWNTRRHQVRLKGMAPVQYRSHPIRAA